MKSPTNKYHLKGDVVVVKHVGQIYDTTLILPNGVRAPMGGIKALVIDWGIVPQERRKNPKHAHKKFFVCDVLNEIAGSHHDDYEKNQDIFVIVPSQFGTRNLFPEYPDHILYDGEDVLAIVEQ